MAVAHDFKYYRPENLAEALRLMTEFPGKARLLAGGTDLAVYIKEGLEHPEAVIDVKNLCDLSGIQITDTELMIGAKTTFSDILASEEIKTNFLMLWEAARTVASVGIRNRATVVGNICSAVPSLDSAPALLCYDAVVHTVSLAGKRAIPITEWFIAPRKTALKADEIVVGISISWSLAQQAGIYLKLGRYGGEDLAQAGLGILMNDKLEYKIAYCAVNPIPKRSTKLEDMLHGKVPDTALIAALKAQIPLEINPITDIRSGKEYRIHICKVMLERGLEAVQARQRGEIVNSLKVLGG
jgi:carbon-monoxide dehydrogenase medium subunit